MKNYILTIFFVILALVSFQQVFAESDTISDRSDAASLSHEGTVEWVSRCSLSGSTSIVRVIDHDMYKDPQKIEQFNVKVWSDYDYRIVAYAVTETGSDTGIFEATIFLTTPDDSPGKRIRSVDDSTVFAKYVDYTPLQGAEKVDVIDTFVMSGLSVLERGDDGYISKIVYDPCAMELFDKNKDWFYQLDIFYPAPLKQIESGLYLHEIKCKSSLKLIQKPDGTPVCALPQTIPKLAERGWMTCPDGVNYHRVHPCGPHSNGSIIISDSYKKIGFEPPRITEDQRNLIDAKQKLEEIHGLDSSFGPFTIKDVITEYGIDDDSLAVDVLAEYYYESNYLDLIKQKVRDIVGKKVTVEFFPSGEIAPAHIESVFLYVWNSFLHGNQIQYTPKDQPYINTYEEFYDLNRVCSPIVASNGTELYVSSVFISEPFEITETSIDKIKPDDCHKTWKTDMTLVKSDRALMLWLKNYHDNN